jgi:hypothetical protein
MSVLKHLCLKVRLDWALWLFVMCSMAQAQPDPSAGRATYQRLCQSCHSAPPDHRAMLAANNVDSLTTALNQVSGMGFLNALLTRSDIENMAAYIGIPALSQNVLTVASRGEGRGFVTSSPIAIFCGANCAAAFAPNAMVRLSVVADFGSRFSGWLGACADAGVSSDCNLRLDGARVVFAQFQRIGHHIDHTGHWLSDARSHGVGMSVVHSASTGQLFNLIALANTSESAARGDGSDWYVMPNGDWRNDFTRYQGPLYRLADLRIDAARGVQFASAPVGLADMSLSDGSRIVLAFTFGAMRGEVTMQPLFAIAPTKPTPRAAP